MRHALIIKRIQQIRADMPRIGTRKLHYLLSQTLSAHQVTIGRDQLFDLLCAYGMLVRKRKRRKTYTTDSNHPFRKYPNLIRDKVVMAANELWVSDITYISLTGSYCYLSLVTDAYSRKIVGYCLYPTLQKEGPLLALDKALKQWDGAGSLTHHSDRGLQYCCADYIRLLSSRGIVISMTEMGDPYENAIAERVNGILKQEFDLGTTFKSMEQAVETVKRAVDIYNNDRPHGSCDYLTPDQAHQKTGLLTSKWRRKNEMSPL
jgi:transposase InsO family protein